MLTYPNFHRAVNRASFIGRDDPQLSPRQPDHDARRFGSDVDFRPQQLLGSALHLGAAR
jgi:hypothetical protein